VPTIFLYYLRSNLRFKTNTIMNNVSEDYLFMFLKVRNHYTANAAVLDTVTPLPAEYVTFNSSIDTYILQLANSGQDLTGYTLDKTNKRKTLEQLALQVSNSLTAHSIANNNPINRKLADFSTSYFANANAEELITNCKTLQLLAQPLSADLAIYGPPAPEVPALIANLVALILANPQGSLAIDTRKENAVLAERTRLKIMDQLVNKIDVLVRVFETSDQMLYETYLAARAIDVTGTPTAPDYEGTVMGDQPFVIAAMPYIPNRELRMQVTGGNANWGLGEFPDVILYVNPIAPGENPRLKCETIGPDGDLIMIQAVGGVPSINFKLWVYEA